MIFRFSVFLVRWKWERTSCEREFPFSHVMLPIWGARMAPFKDLLRECSFGGPLHAGGPWNWNAARLGDNALLNSQARVRLPLVGGAGLMHPVASKSFLMLYSRRRKRHGILLPKSNVVWYLERMINMIRSFSFWRLHRYNFSISRRFFVTYLRLCDRQCH